MATSYFIKAMSHAAYYIRAQNTVVKSWTSLVSGIETRRIWKCSEKSLKKKKSLKEEKENLEEDIVSLGWV